MRWRVTDSTEEAGTDDIVTRFEYDDDSRTLTRAIKRNPGDTTYQETEYVYDERSRLITLRRPDGDIFTHRYDVNGNRVGWTDPLGTTVTDTYDARNLISYRNIVRGMGIVGTDYESYEFDGLGRLQSCSNYADGELITASAWQYNTQSQPERFHQTIADKDGAPLGTWTSGAEYDATGFNTATIYSNGRRVDHLKDQLDRLSASYDEENAIYIAAYVYGGPRRIVERTLGNGTRTSYTYEASGCGCGGATQFIERVEHTEIGNGRTLWATNRRHDIRGLVTAESRDQEGANGNVFRYDEAKRLDTSYFGVDLYSTALTTYADQSNTPSVFGKRTNYPLDPRGNRTSVVEYDDASNTIYDYDYTANTDTNQYTAVDGASYTYDAIEQMTTDPTRDLDYAYDYKGQVITEEADSDNPERRYSYDNQGRRRTEANFYEASYHMAELTCFCYPSNCMCCTGGCGGNAGPQTLEEHVYNGAGSLTYSVYHVFGPGAVGGLSGSARHPATPAFPRGGMVHGPLRVAELVDPVSGNDEWKYRYEDQLGSLIGMADDAGNKLADYVYLDYGRAIERPIAFDGDHEDVNEGGSANMPLTSIAITGASFTTDEFIGMQLAVADPANGQVIVRTVIGNNSTTITIDESTSEAYDAIVEGDLSFVIYDFVDTNVATSGAYHTAGEWTSNPSYSSPSTTFTDSGADFKSYMVGWLIGVKVEDFTYLEIIDVPSATTVKVKGDADTLAAPGDRYWLFAPPHVDPSTGAARGSNDGGTFIPDYDTHYLWGLYRYQPPMTGYFVDPDGAPVEGVYGDQTEDNKSGNYHAGARTYDPQTGRWTTPDPAMTPWRNLLDYLDNDPLGVIDPTGLSGGYGGTPAWDPMGSPAAEQQQADLAIDNANYELKSLQEMFDAALAARNMDEAARLLDEMDEVVARIKLYRKLRPKYSVVEKWRRNYKAVSAGKAAAWEEWKQREQDFEDEIARRKEHDEAVARGKVLAEREAEEEKRRAEREERIAKQKADDDARAALEAKRRKAKRTKKCPGAASGAGQAGSGDGETVCLDWDTRCLADTNIKSLMVDYVFAPAVAFECNECVYCLMNGGGSKYSSYSPTYCSIVCVACLGSWPAKFIMDNEAANKCCLKWGHK